MRMLGTAQLQTPVGFCMGGMTVSDTVSQCDMHIYCRLLRLHFVTCTIAPHAPSPVADWYLGTIALCNYCCPRKLQPKANMVICDVHQDASSW